ncbi:MAG: phosphotransferase [Gemmatimonadota bacterium]
MSPWTKQCGIVMQDRLIRLFTERFGARPEAILKLSADGSNRRYLRLFGPGGEAAIGAIGPDHEENRAFLSYSRAFRGAGFPVPEIYGADEAAGVWLMEDLGDTTLFEALEEARRNAAEGYGQGRGDRGADDDRAADGGGSADGGFPESMFSIYRRVLEWLPRFQVEGHALVDYRVAYPRAAFDRQSILWDLNYFKYHFLKLAHVPFNEARLERDFRRLTTFLLRADTDHFLYRDFQSRNVMLRAGEPWFIDYQGGRRGALQYDVASLLYDAKADIPEEVREGLLQHYLDALEEYRSVDRARFRKHYLGYAIARIMQAMGAYGYRGFFERKPRFLKSVPYAARNLAAILERGLPVRLPEVEAVFRRIAEEWAGEPAERVAESRLTVDLTSFSYGRGYPEDAGAHGGGFVFDCRALPNPGRLPEYERLTGRDREVIQYIERCPELEAFWQHTRALAEAQIQEYVRRGFTSLGIAFGCTGGQHRSPYLVERLARHLQERYPDVRVRVHHREEPSWPHEAGEAGAAAEAARPESVPETAT